MLRKLVFETVILLILALISTYLLPNIIDQVLLIGLIIYTYKTKHFAPLLVLLMALLFGPGDLFESTLKPKLSILPGYSFLPSDIIFVILTFRIIRIVSIKKYYFIKPVIFILILLIIYLPVTFLYADFGGYHNMSFLITHGIRVHVYFLLYIVFSFTLLYQPKSYLLFFYSIVFFAGIGVLDQFVKIISSESLKTLFFGGQTQTLEFGRSIPSGFYFVVLAFVLGFLNQQYKKIPLQKNILIFIIGMTALSMFLSATRQWVIFLIIATAGSLILNREFKKILTYPALFLFLIVILISTNLLPKNYFKNALSRNQTITNITSSERNKYGGELLYGVPVGRIEDSKSKIENFVNSGYLGTGLFAPASNDVGTLVNYLSKFGILGLIAYIYFYYLIFKKLKKRKRLSAYKYKTLLNSLLSVWFGLFIISLATQDFFLYYGKVTFIVFVLALTDYHLKDTLNKNKAIPEEA